MKSPIYPDLEMNKIIRHGIEIEYCPKSGGVWLDKGELEKLIALSSQEIDDMAPKISERRNSNSDDHYDDDYRHNNHKPRKKESIFSEIFDIF